MLNLTIAYFGKIAYASLKRYIYTIDVWISKFAWTILAHNEKMYTFLLESCEELTPSGFKLNILFQL